MSTDRYSAIGSWVDSHRGDIVKAISRLVAIKSVRGEPQEGMPFGSGPKRALDEALEICAALGFQTAEYGGAVGTADLCEGERKLDILAHLDVVDAGKGWDTDPFTAVEKEGCLYGRGTDDNKGALIAALYAMLCVKELGIPLKNSVRLIMGTDEESGSGDLPYYFSTQKSAPNTFTPDSEFPVCNVEKGRYTASLTAKWDKKEVLPRVTAFEGGYRINVVPAEAFALVEGLGAEDTGSLQEAAELLGVSLEVRKSEKGIELKVSGTAAHASRPETGTNGITAMLALLSGLPLADCPSSSAICALGELFAHGDFNGKALGIDMSDDVSGEMTISLTRLKLDDAGAEGCFDARIPVCATKENCSSVAEARLAERGFAADGKMIPAHVTPCDSKFVQTLLRCYQRVSGQKGECYSMGGGTYVHDIEGGVAFGATFPGFVSNLHGANERVCIDNLLDACKIFALVITELCS